MELCGVAVCKKFTRTHSSLPGTHWATLPCALTSQFTLERKLCLVTGFGSDVPDWRQAELTRILKEINASRCTTIRKFLIQSQEMKPADWNVGMLGDRSRNVSLPWQGFCLWGSGNWYGLILLFTLVLWTFVLPHCWLQLTFAIWLFLCFSGRS